MLKRYFVLICFAPCLDIGYAFMLSSSFLICWNQSWYFVWLYVRFCFVSSYDWKYVWARDLWFWGKISILPLTWNSVEKIFTFQVVFSYNFMRALKNHTSKWPVPRFILSVALIFSCPWVIALLLFHLVMPRG